MDLSADRVRERVRAKYYQKHDRGLKCMLCPHMCVVDKGEYGICRFRRNIDGELYALGYGQLCALHIDPIEKKPLYHFLPGSPTLSIASGGCNMSCLNCQNWEISQASPYKVRTRYLSPEGVVDYANKHKCKIISYTYTDPVVNFEFVLETATLAKRQGIKNVLVSAGYINKEPLLELSRVIDAANIDLKGFDNEIYLKLNGAKLAPVLDTLVILKDAGVWLEITNLLIPEWSDKMEQIEKMCDWLVEFGFSDVPLHFSRFVPANELLHLVSTPTAVLHAAIKMAIKKGMRYVYSGNVRGDKYENTYCADCHESLITRQTYEVDRNKLLDGECFYCKSTIPGVFRCFM